MLPTLGQIVLYHFTHIEGRTVLGNPITTTRTRPAVVIGLKNRWATAGYIELHPFYGTGDVFYGPGDVEYTDSGHGIRPHQEPGLPMGVVKDMEPTPGTWSWPPRVG